MRREKIDAKSLILLMGHHYHKRQFDDDLLDQKIRTINILIKRYARNPEETLICRAGGQSSYEGIKAQLPEKMQKLQVADPEKKYRIHEEFMSCWETVSRILFLNKIRYLEVNMEKP